MSPTYRTHDDGAQRRDEILTTQRDRYDHVKVEPVNPGDPASPVRVLARRVGDHTTWEEV